MGKGDYAIRHIPGERSCELMPYVQMAGMFRCDPDYVAKRKKYDSVLLVSSFAGKGYLRYRNREYLITPDAGFIIDCNEPQVYFTDRTDLWEFAWVHFKGGQCMEQARFILENAGPVFRGKANEEAGKSIGKILECLKQRGMQCDIRTAGHLNGFLYSMMLDCVPGEAECKPLPDLMGSAVEYMERNYAEKIQIEDLAKALFMNPYDLIRKFRKYLGLTPHQYLMKYRINQSKMLLAGTELTVSEIADKVGFTDSSHFIRAFKRNEGVTPLKYRGSGY